MRQHVLTFVSRIMEKYTDSDLTMVAAKSFDQILHQITSSSLNYHLQVTPYSAIISLKKSLLNDKSGYPMQPRPNQALDNVHHQELIVKNLKLQAELQMLKERNEELIKESDYNHETIKGLLGTVKEKEDIIYKLEKANQTARLVADRLNKALTDTRVSFEQEKNIILKEHKVDIKSWKKDLGKARQNQIKLEKKLELLQNTNIYKETVISEHDSKCSASDVPPSTEVVETTCSICAIPIPNFIPSYFCGEQINSVCEKCLDSSQYDDPFASFSESGMPPSLASHWLPITYLLNQNPGSLSTMRSHCFRLPNPGDSFVTSQEMLEEMRLIWKKEREECKVS